VVGCFNSSVSRCSVDVHLRRLRSVVYAYPREEWHGDEKLRKSSAIRVQSPHRSIGSSCLLPGDYNVQNVLMSGSDTALARQVRPRLEIRRTGAIVAHVFNGHRLLLSCYQPPSPKTKLQSSHATKVPRCPERWSKRTSGPGDAIRTCFLTMKVPRHPHSIFALGTELYLSLLQARPPPRLAFPNPALQNPIVYGHGSFPRIICSNTGTIEKFG